MRFRMVGVFVFASVLSATAFVGQAGLAQTAAASSNSAQVGVLSAAETAKIYPATVFFQDQTATAQVRNSGGVRFADKSLMLISLIDTSGYSTQVKEKYQAYLLTESPLEIEGHKLVPGAYGCGFIAGDNFVVMDIGGHDLFTVHSTKDAELRRPTPLQVVAAPGAAGSYRLYAGRSFVTFRAVGEK
jgi:hypothetical protein